MTTPNGNGGPPPGFGMPSNEQLVAMHAQQVEQNIAGFKELLAMGIKFDPMAIMHSRIDHLIEGIASAMGESGPQWALVVKLKFEQQIGQNLQEARKEGTKAQLSQGASFTPGMIAQLAAETGTFTGRKRPPGPSFLGG